MKERKDLSKTRDFVSFFFSFVSVFVYFISATISSTLPATSLAATDGELTAFLAAHRSLHL